jgi:peptidyl-prolyl cis-trans isomerase D
VRAELSEALITRKRDELIAARAKSLSERIRKGESVEAVAASSGYRAVKVASLTRQGLQEYAGLGRDMVGTIVNGSKGQVFTVAVPNKEGKLEGLAVGKITAIRPAAVDQVAQATEMGRDTFGRGILQDIDSTTRGWAREQVKPKSDRDRAISALGLDPKDYAEAKDDAKAPAKDEKSK